MKCYIGFIPSNHYELLALNYELPNDFREGLGVCGHRGSSLGGGGGLLARTRDLYTLCPVYDHKQVRTHREGEHAQIKQGEHRARRHAEREAHLDQ